MLGQSSTKKIRSVARLHLWGAKAGDGFSFPGALCAVTRGFSRSSRGSMRKGAMTSTPGLSAIVLAAGKGTRMKSQLPKVLHPLCGRPLLEYPVTAAFEAGAEQVVVVTSGQPEI